MTGKRSAWILNSKGVKTREQSIADLHRAKHESVPPHAPPKQSDAKLTKLADAADAAAGASGHAIP